MQDCFQCPLINLVTRGDYYTQHESVPVAQVSASGHMQSRKAECRIKQHSAIAHAKSEEQLQAKAGREGNTSNIAEFIRVVFIADTQSHRVTDFLLQG